MNIKSTPGCSDANCHCSSNGRGATWNRREFLKTAGLAVGLLAGSPVGAMAGPFTRNDFDRLVPADKKLREDWTRSLTERGEPAVYHGGDLEKIGMPIGGLCAGQLYLGGDGRLWCWDIFNQRVSTGAEHYAKPLTPSFPVEQGFGIKVSGKEMRPLDMTHWSNVQFKGQYPIAFVSFSDGAMPVKVDLQAFSPFIPLNTEDSSLPATVFEFTVSNVTAGRVEVELSGWLENAVCLHSSRTRPGLRHNNVVRAKDLLAVSCSAGAGSAQEVPTKTSDQPAAGSLADEPDFGTLVLGIVDPKRSDSARPDTAESTERSSSPASATKPLGEKLVGSVTRKLVVAPNSAVRVAFVLAWHMPNLRMSRLPPGRHYASRFGSALDVAAYVSNDFNRLTRQTRLWHDTWYDSTLPFWFLDRTFLNTSILATSTAYRFGNGRFYGWEGVGCCEGTCAHVWQYAHAVARLFPDLERMTREKIDFGLALQPDGAIHFRGEFNDFPAIDAQAGAILRALREHQMSVDSGFLNRTWPAIKRATQWLIAKDGDGDGLIQSNQHNTLDTDWFGPVSWLSGLYLAALLAAETMAHEVGDLSFASDCRRIFIKGQKNITDELFDGEYFINKPDPRHLDAINSGTGCEIDQVFGQSWAFQVGLPRVFPKPQTLSALKSLYRYNFSPDVGPYRKEYTAGRWYAMPGEAGLLMCTFPRADWDYSQAKGKGPDWAAGYFNECMNGFEYQAAGHMIWEGLVTEGLAVTRAVHDRYHPSRRNPWNEIECGDHYARSMASYGVFLAACGYEYHGPSKHLGFAPKVFGPGPSKGNFKAAFTTAAGWGTFSQTAAAEGMNCLIALKSGSLEISTLSFEVPAGTRVQRAEVKVRGRRARHHFEQKGQRILLTLENPALIRETQAVEVRLGLAADSAPQKTGIAPETL